MICKRCGTKNRDGRTKCFHCGYVFPVLTDQTEYTVPEPRHAKKAAAPAPKAEAPSDAFSVEPLRRKPVSSSPAEAAADAAPAAVEAVPAADGRVNETYEVEARAVYEDEAREDESYEDEAYGDEAYEDEVYEDETDDTLDEDEEDAEAYRVPEVHKNTGLNIALWLFSLVFIILLIAVGLLLYVYLRDDGSGTGDPDSPGHNVITQGTAQERFGIQEPFVEVRQSVNAAEDTLHIVFFGRAGDKLYFGCNSQTIPFEQDSLEVNMKLQDLFQSDYPFTESTVSVNPHAYYVRGEEKALIAMEDRTMRVPDATVKLTALAEGATTVSVYRDTYTLKLWVPSDATVRLDDKDITSQRDNLGMITQVIDTPPNSSSSYQLKVSQPYHKINDRYYFTLNRPSMNVSLDILTTDASVVHQNFLDISGNTEAGAEISVEGLPLIGGVSFDPLYNKYSLRVDLSGVAYGEQEVVITARTSSGTSKLSFPFIYWPDRDSVTTRAGKFEAAMATNAAGYTGRNYVLPSVTVTSIGPDYTVQGNFTYNDVTYPVEFTCENGREVALGEGVKCRVFGRYTGLKNGVMTFTGYYICKPN